LSSFSLGYPQGAIGKIRCKTVPFEASALVPKQNILDFLNSR